MSAPPTQAEYDYLLAELRQRDARITSLRASLDDAHREVSRLAGEKHKRDVVIRQAVEVLESLHAQGDVG